MPKGISGKRMTGNQPPKKKSDEGVVSRPYYDLKTKQRLSQNPEYRRDVAERDAARKQIETNSNLANKSRSTSKREKLIKNSEAADKKQRSAQKSIDDAKKRTKRKNGDS